MTDTTTSATPEHQRATHLPGDTHIWVMVLGDLVIFGAYFVIFMIYRAMTPQEYLDSQQHLDITVGVVNTVVLLTSSWFVARAVAALREGRPGAAIRLTYLGMGCGTLFAVIKGWEWWTKIAHGYTLSTNGFFTFYYMLTGVHLFHVALGVLMLGVVTRELRNPRRRRLSLVESGAIYWHMVDLLWIVIFALFYVMR